MKEFEEIFSDAFVIFKNLIVIPVFKGEDYDTIKERIKDMNNSDIAMAMYEEKNFKDMIMKKIRQQKS